MQSLKRVFLKLSVFFYWKTFSMKYFFFQDRKNTIFVLNKSFYSLKIPFLQWSPLVFWFMFSSWMLLSDLNLQFWDSAIPTANHIQFWSLFQSIHVNPSSLLTFFSAAMFSICNFKLIFLNCVKLCNCYANLFFCSIISNVIHKSLFLIAFGLKCLTFVTGFPHL